MKLMLIIRLAMMMFLQYAVWGAWAPVLHPYLVNPTQETIDEAAEEDPDSEVAKKSPGLGLTETQSGWIFGALWLACILAPFTGGQIADRYIPTQWFLAIAHLLGGGLLLAMAYLNTFPPLMAVMALYCLMYAPTLALTNSLAFQHIDNVERDFGWVRVGGTIGWIVAGWMLTIWRKEYFGFVNMTDQGDALLLAGGLSILLGFFCGSLPHTPPKREGTNPLAFMEAFSLLKDRNFLIFMAIAFVVTTELQFYYLPTASFLEDIGVEADNVPAWMTLAQIAEIIAMAIALPILLPKIGIRNALAIGVIAWPLRYAVFAIGEPVWLVLASLTLHGVGYTFFFVVSQMYVDEVAPKDIRASAQGLLAMVTLGVGNFLGTQLTAFVLEIFKDDSGKQNWMAVFLIPCGLTVACAFAFLLFFKDPKRAQQTPAEPAEIV